jgi:ABC-type bacteriocin/lantibiotic exporter with double-glycine peptidase domain
MTSVQRLQESIEIPQERAEGQVPEETWPSSGKVTFDNVSLRYRPKTPIVLKELSFEIE